MLPPASSKDALFLDFDGTLVDIAPRPDLVEVSGGLLELLAELSDRVGGALAVISGRCIETLDQLLSPHRFAAAGEHGAEIREHRNGPIHHSYPLDRTVIDAAAELAQQLPGTLLERKTASISLHYRQIPELGAAARDGMQKILDNLDGYELLEGKMVVELKPSGVNKGTAIQVLMSHAPFTGRRPVFLGDDVTDEPGFAATNSLGGVSVRVGSSKPSAASHMLSDVVAARAWLGRLELAQ